ncbi:class I SAM-dependent methyltransferase [Oleiagrimonas soli]|uniref:Methyltransferase n=1 Tax=Oleiagrimonas soli TaxID=1543381 RepID=A0A099CWQ8_9GAMM|nr:class I SAM-dependent methyltransferase [Oleiagrimonas soli]KGI78423.1 methyltransferase [Oleiagrimonas soli]MBB6183425.1 putative methyltransferase [Oleiagrimonas soli]
MNRWLTPALVAGFALCLSLSTPVRADRGQPATIKVPAYIAKALADPARAKDQANDDRRRPGPILAFAGVKPGDTVIELVPGGGYWTRILSQIVGPKGHVYTVTPSEFLKVFPTAADKSKALAADPHYANVTALVQPAAGMKLPHRADLVFTAENVHDYNNASFGSLPPKALATEIRGLLKSGGIFLVNDHVAPKGSGLSDTDTLHRIDPAIVKKQVTEAGFTFVGASDVLRNPKDPHDIKVFDPSIRGHTDQFVYKFRKP